MRGCLVTGTDTGVGKTVLSAAIVAALAARGEQVRAHKPIITGGDEPPAVWPPDDQLLAQASGRAPSEVTPVRFGPPVSPHLAAQLAGDGPTAQELLTAAEHAGAHDGPLVVEGVGGLLVPLVGAYTVCDLAADLGLPLLIAARPGLGTINHSLLTLAAARAAGLRVAAVVLGPWPQRPGALERSNRETIARLGQVDVATLPWLAAPDMTLLAAAGAQLPLDRWLAPARARLTGSVRSRP